MCHPDRRSTLAALILAFVSIACSREPAPAAAAQSSPPAASPAEAATAAPPAAPAAVKTAAPASIAPGTGWIEGTLTDSTGVPAVISDVFGNHGVPMGLKAEEGDVNSASEPTTGGFFTFRNLKPGTYELFIQAAHRRGASDQPLRPVRVSGIVVEAGKRTVLNVKMEPGQELQEIGKPVLTSQTFVVFSDELARLQAQIDELKKK